MVREFNIEINSDYGWEIDVSGFIPPYENYKSIENAPMGICVEEDDKVIAIYENVPPYDEMIAATNELEIFKEECKFTHLKNSFTGTFVDALIYIHNEYENE